MTKVTDFPEGRTDIDGLAIGGGKFWMTAQDAASNSILIYPYDLATNTYGTKIVVPLTDGTNRASGATWAPGALPEPGAIGVMSLSALAAMARRRRARIG